MSNYINIQEKNYIYEVDYKDNEVYRNSFNKLAERTFGINFENWYREGYWGDSYIPYSLLDGKKVVSNISISIMDILIDDEEKRYIQIGTVMTDENYRNKGLNRILMEKIIDEWENKCDCIYLYANDSVLNFYPKFGFEKCNEYQFSINKVKEKALDKVSKLNVKDIRDKELLIKFINNKISLSKIHVLNNTSLIMFYCIDFMKENIYYIKDYESIAICEYKFDILYIQDIFSIKEVNLDEVINVLITEETKKVILGFTPKDTSSYEESLLNEEDTKLFIKYKKENQLKKEKLMFPILSHA